MKNQTLILLLVAGACGFVTMLGVKQYLSKQGKKEEAPTVQVLVAAGPINPGDALNELNTQFITIDEKNCPKGAVSELEQIEERSVKVPRGAGDWILVDQLTEKGAGITGVIPPGMRVATIPVDATTNHSGMLRPGNRIDLLLTYKNRDTLTGQQGQKTVPLLQFIEVFAVDDKVYGITNGGGNTQARNISLLVTPEQMMKLTLAKRTGDISTVMRSSEDMDEISITEITEDNLKGREVGGINTTSTLDIGEQLGGFGFSLPGPESIMGQLEAEYHGVPQASGPVAATAPAEEEDKGEYWTMAIHESGAVRVEKVNLKSDEPIDTTGRSTPSAPKVGPLPVPQAGLDDLGLGGSGDLEEAASGLLDLLN
ncbi:MAG: Flp pilus assembly protein CpaB [Planctomycetaceae bacterium]|nr:Flp pilus assembly protein CpaB [Planctomycetaceae bacterium]